jgi:hypothetical protein
MRPHTELVGELVHLLDGNRSALPKRPHDTQEKARAVRGVIKHASVSVSFAIASVARGAFVVLIEFPFHHSPHEGAEPVPSGVGHQSRRATAGRLSELHRAAFKISLGRLRCRGLTDEHPYEMAITNLNFK